MIYFNKNRTFLAVVVLSILAFAFYSFRILPSKATASNVHKLKDVAVNNTDSINNSSAKHFEVKKTKKIKIALLLDTSNSMDGLIDQAKAQLWILVEELAKAKCDDSQKPQVEIALYEYGNDNLSEREGYIRMVTPLTYDLDKLSDDLFKLTTRGGSEYCGQVIQTACNQLDWSSDGEDYQVIFIAGNEEFTQGRVNYKEACALAKRKNIIVNTIFCGPFSEGINGQWKAGADLSNGSYISIEQDKKTVFISSPYDDRITELNNQLNKTYVEYGKIGKEKKMSQETQDKNASSYGKENVVKRTISKSTHIYKNESWDLVDASDEKTFDISKMKSEDLPEDMRNMSDHEKQVYIETKKAEREKIKGEITALSKKREIHVAQQKKSGEEDKMLDKVMLESIRKQAATKNLSF